jgi:2-polyprenyl-3-methyl-5-hydroxy-6-metoxy-1,4-benzoquinol methylase
VRELDFGGGKENGWKTVGVEPSDKARAIALKRQFLCRRHFGIRKSLFDVITMWHVLEHVPNLDKQIKELKRLLKPSGTLIVAFLISSMQNITALGQAVPIHFGIFKKSDKIFEKRSN